MLRAEVWRLNTDLLVSEVDSECFCIAALQWFKASCAKYIAQTCGPQKWKHCVKRYRCCWAFEAVDWWKATDRTGQIALNTAGSCEKHLDKTALSRRSKSVLTYLTPLVHSPRRVPTRCRRRWRCRRVVAPRWAQMRPSDAQECSPSQPPPSRLSSPACLTTIVDIRLRPGQVLPPGESVYTRATAEPSRG